MRAFKIAIIFIFWLFLCFPELYSQESGESKLKFGFIYRFRFVSWDNAIHLDKNKKSESTFTRHRTNLSLNWNPRPNFLLSLKLTNEFRYYFIPSNTVFNLHEIFVDNLFLKWSKLFDLPVDLSLGRQNMMLGEGFVVMDGHPLDGSRSIYFNALRADLNFNKSKKLIFFYTYQPQKDTWLPAINDQKQPLIEQPEKGIGLYFQQISKRSDYDIYYIRKYISSISSIPVDSTINTFGGKIKIPIVPAFSLTAEAAFQSGSYGDHGRNAFGGYYHLDYMSGFNFPEQYLLTFGGIYLSGDDAGTPKMEGWDPLFSRWPKWSEAYIYTLIPEYKGKVAYWSNFASIYAEMKFNVTSKINLNLTYHHLTAPKLTKESIPFPGGTGNNRGELIITRLNIHLNRKLSGHLHLEKFYPGNYYWPEADNYYWLRVELMYTY
ncbi:MAG: hypothetical protein JW755_06205 [Candidatus Aminicenantes bacterium]|nr:hypothetical protein [Candidatus Aminicenantes bacterium]